MHEIIYQIAEFLISRPRGDLIQVPEIVARLAPHDEVDVGTALQRMIEARLLDFPFNRAEVRLNIDGWEAWNDKPIVRTNDGAGIRLRSRDMKARSYMS